MTAEVSYPGVYIEETRTSVKVIPGVATQGVAQSKMSPSTLLAGGYKIVQSHIEPGGLSILFAKGNDHVLVRMVDVREGNSTDGKMVVVFAGKLP